VIEWNSFSDNQDVWGPLMVKSQNVALICLIALCGCRLLPSRSEPRYVDPALPMTMSRIELVDYLNKKHQGLTSWRDIDMSLGVHLPNGLYQRLSGTIACEAPNRFRLTASNFMAKADFGSNSDRCWVYVKPGDPAVLTWTHDDAPLLQHMPVDIPRIDPEWLMLVLGVSPLKHEDYELDSAPTGERELWLTAIEDNYSGRPLRRVIKVDTIEGVVREHAIYDSERNPLVKAILSRHKSINGHVLPQVVQLKFPQLETELKLTFSRIETGYQLADKTWEVPRNYNADIVDLGQLMRYQMANNPSLRASVLQQSVGPASSTPEPAVSLKSPDFARRLPNEFRAWNSLPPDPSAGTASVDDPDWDKPVVTASAEPDWDDPSAIRPASNRRKAPDTFSNEPVKRKSRWRSLW
jgi:hypothetical protein